MVRWPLAFFIVYVGVGLADPRIGPTFALASGVVIAEGCIILSLGMRGTGFRKTARLPREQRASRLSIDSERLRHEAVSGHAGEYPISALTHPRMSHAGALLIVGGRLFFVPRRAMHGAEEYWRAFIASIPIRPWPTGVGFTCGLWAFALATAAYAFLH